MSNPTPQQYANLADDAYNTRKITKNNESINIGGYRYKVLAVHTNPRNGYYGAVYQDIQTNAVIVAHRGTEPFTLKDWQTNIGMVANQINNQAADAEELTQKAFKAIDDFHKNNRNVPHPTITQTGHSLGGNHAQTQAFRHNQRGVTFNAYGAAGMYGIPEGGNSVTNYMKATDPVAAASPHFGKTILLATPDEISNLKQHRYAHNRQSPDIDTAKAASVAAEVLKVHLMNNFTGPQSVLNNPAARTLAEQEKEMIRDYRNDVEQIRSRMHQGVQNYNTTRELIEKDPNNMSYNGFEPYGQQPQYAHARISVADSTSFNLSSMPKPFQNLYPKIQAHLNTYHEKYGIPIDEEKKHNAAVALSVLAYSETMGKRQDVPLLFNIKDGQYLIGERNPGLIKATMDMEQATSLPLEQSLSRVQDITQQFEQQELELQMARQQSRGMSMG